jgi:hypothetical protein
LCNVAISQFICELAGNKTHTQKKRLEEYVDAKQFAASDVCDSQVISELRRLKFKELTISKFK